MLRLFVLSIVIILLTSKADGQDSLNYRSKWILGPAIGVSIPLNKFFKNDVTDGLIGYSDRPAIYWQIVSTSFFFNKHWGIEFNVQGLASRNMSTRDDRFSQKIRDEYADNYYVTPSTGLSYDEPIFLGNLVRGFVGVIYRIESNRFLVYPTFRLGAMSMDVGNGGAYLKEKNTNAVLDVRYSAEDLTNEYLVAAPSIILGYKLTGRISFTIDVMTSYAHANITFKKTTTDLKSGQSVAERIKYKRNMLALGIGAGLQIMMR